MFRDVVAVNTWTQTFKDKGLFRYCVDMVTLIMLCAKPYEAFVDRFHEVREMLEAFNDHYD